MAEATAPIDGEALGIAGLNQVLGGKLPSNNLVFLVGAPGAGKTVMAMQMACAAVQQHEHVLFLTAFSESHDKLIAHMRTFSFFDIDFVGQQITLLSILSLMQAATEDVTREVTRLVRQSRAKLIVIDGFGGIRELFATDHQRRQFLQTLGTQLTYTGATLLVTLEASLSDEQLSSSEITIADTVIALRYTTVGWRHQRLLEVRKVRGQQPMSGLHRYRIDVAGITVFPRLEAQQVPTPPSPSAERVSLGSSELDALFGGGINQGTSTIVAGSVGTGKTLLGLQFLLAGALRGENGLYITLHETPEQLVALARAFGFDLQAMLQANLITILRRPPVELDVDELAVALQVELRAHAIQRLVFDGMGVLQKSLDRDNRTHDYLAALVELLRFHQITSLMNIEVNLSQGPELDFSETPLVVLGENVVLLRQLEIERQFQRTITVLRMRFSVHDRVVRSFTISPEGVQLIDTQDRPITSGPKEPRSSKRSSPTRLASQTQADSSST